MTNTTTPNTPTPPNGPSAREEILTRIHHALHPGNTTGTDTDTRTAADAAAAAARDAAQIPRDYLSTHTRTDTAGLIALLTENLTDYRAHVHHTPTETTIPALISQLITGPRLAIPQGLPPSWIPEDAQPLHDQPPLDPATLETAHAVITTCALAIAETGTIVLDAGPGQGRRALTLIPDHHICIIRTRQIHSALPEALPHLNPTQPQTWIAGPSATSDIELNRIEGVHGPRRLDVIIVIED